jgi:hypothetical protein
LLDLLQHRGFPPRFRNWVAAIFVTATSRVLLNGIAGEPIGHARGLRQGDPLSPLLFMLAIDSLTHILEGATRHGLLHKLRGRGRFCAPLCMRMMRPCSLPPSSKTFATSRLFSNALAMLPVFVQTSPRALWCLLDVEILTLTTCSRGFQQLGPLSHCVILAFPFRCGASGGVISNTSRTNVLASYQLGMVKTLIWPDARPLSSRSWHPKLYIT